MKRILWTITAVGALAVPVGLATAQSDEDVTDTESPTTTVECDQEQLREQLRLQDGSGDQTRTQQRLQAHECEECEQAHERVRHQVRVEEGRGDMVRNQVRIEDCDGCTGDQTRTRAQVEDSTGPGAGVGQQDTRRYQEQDHVPGVGNEDAPGRAGR